MKKMKAAEVVLDFDLYPRNNIDSGNVTGILLAMDAGVELPPIITDRKSKRCIDGFHRVKAALRRDKNADIVAIEKDYANEREMFLDAMRFNAAHGARLDPCDKAHCLIVAERLKISIDKVAGALHVTQERLEDLRISRTARHKGLSIALKRTTKKFAGKQLTARQVEANGKLSGMNQAFYARQLIELIESDMLDLEDDNLLIVLQKLHGLLDGVLAATA